MTEIIAALREKATWCVLERQKSDKELFTNAADALEAAGRDTNRLTRALERIGFFFAGHNEYGDVGDKILLVLKGKTIEEAIKLTAKEELIKGAIADHVCIIHGKKMSEHACLYCCLCFKPLTPEECSVNDQGQKQDVCVACAEAEKNATPTESPRS